MAPVPDPGPRPPGLCCCPTLKLYASSSLDCTIRIWTAENRLLRWAGARRAGGRDGSLGDASWAPLPLPPTRAQELGMGEGLALLPPVAHSLEQGWTLAVIPLQAPAAERCPSGSDLLQQQW